jgi:hypothetical protein
VSTKEKRKKASTKKSLDYMIFSTNNYEQSLFSTSSLAPDCLNEQNSITARTLRGGVNIFFYFQDYLVGENTNKGGGADFVFCIDSCW